MTTNGFPAETWTFLRELAANNNRSWFNDHKPSYKQFVEAPAQRFLGDLKERLEILMGYPVKGKVYRFYRDVRFSKDKTPYNTHVRMSLSRDMSGTKECCDLPAFHFSLEVDRVIMGVGSFLFSKPVLEAYREAVVAEQQGEKLQRLLIKYQQERGFRLDPPELKRVPNGYDKEHKRADLLRRKGLVVWYESPVAGTWETADAVADTIARYKAMVPIHDWLVLLQS